MGLCFSADDAKSSAKKRRSKRITTNSAAVGGGGSNLWTRIRSSRKEENLIHEQTLAAAILYQQLQNGSGRTSFDRSTSSRYSFGNPRRSQTLPRNSSFKARSLTDLLQPGHDVVNQV